MSTVNLSKLDLGSYDFILVVDRSGSMDHNDCPGKITRWDQAKDWCKGVADICNQYDDDGLDVVFFDDEFIVKKGVGVSEIDQLFNQLSPRYTTDTAGALKKALPEYFKSSKGGFFSRKKDTLVKRNKPVVVLIFTDGRPNNQTTLEDAIIEITRKISNRSEVGISFLQVGSDEGARAFLKSLDDNLENKGAAFDIVDTKNFDELQNGSVEDIIIDALSD